jgi:hypothetical protein
VKRTRIVQTRRRTIRLFVTGRPFAPEATGSETPGPSAIGRLLDLARRLGMEAGKLRKLIPFVLLLSAGVVELRTYADTFAPNLRAVSVTALGFGGGPIRSDCSFQTTSTIRTPGGPKICCLFAPIGRYELGWAL